MAKIKRLRGDDKIGCVWDVPLPNVRGSENFGRGACSLQYAELSVDLTQGRR